MGFTFHCTVAQSLDQRMERGCSVSHHETSMGSCIFSPRMHEPVDLRMIESNSILPMFPYSALAVGWRAWRPAGKHGLGNPAAPAQLSTGAVLDSLLQHSMDPTHSFSEDS